MLVAIGRHSSVVKTGLDKFDCKISDKGKVYTDRNCRLICDKLEDVYAVGDCVEGKPELTPTAIMDGKLLAGRLLNVHKENVCWTNVATTV